MHGASTTRRAKIWLVLNPSDDAYEKRLRRTLEQAAAELGAKLTIRRTKSRKMSAEGDRARPIKILEPLDANELYRDLCINKCYVLSRGAVYVLHNPRRAPPTKRDCVPLESFVDHRAAYRTLEEDIDTVAELKKMMTAETPSDCTTHHDPRVLPLHVFDRNADGTRLDTEDGRNAFHRKYGRNARNGHWQSDATGSWTPADPRAMHGTDPSGEALRIWDLLLPSGYHWDANAGRRRRTIVATASEWRVEPRGYVNIYPNSHIRRGANARRIWQAQRWTK